MKLPWQAPVLDKDPGHTHTSTFSSNARPSGQSYS